MQTALRLGSWVLIAGIAWGIGYYHNARYGGNLSWLRRLYESKMAIASEPIEAPRRLLIMGGSGAHFTIDSVLLQEQLGIPVLNLGLDGPVGLNVILPSILQHVQPGDVVLLIPEYNFVLWDDDGISDRSAALAIATGQPTVGNIPAKELAQEGFLLGVLTLRGAVESTWDLIEEGKLTGYYSDVTAQGDPIAYQERTGKWWQMVVNKPPSKHAIKRISQFKTEVEAKGGTLILSLPWIYGDRNDKTIKNVQITIEKLEKIAPLIYDPDTLNVQSNVSWFADTHYHLNPEGRKVRGEQLVKELKPILDSLPEPNPTSGQN
ncbi:hypothetical protein PN466_23845 [Roseofilum reptotaenium CS-1145]|uniref:SGNH hydrolase-type esterase domain-containing protein n=1 Tax=Roseofilum reptotaenium AO1-A TaxID=1925591 RepID=A0A1L9QY68_9CYAN|nr:MULTISPECIES: hypothetical protein [Roseofilum]MBP0028546.1 hypothetical protein [Roseofilum sp. Guam]MDB9519983.1 hypothetical protein [Roseofilum reptotaenium CS-1145]OJJ27596.1 hypothetical protein BI308_01115 [Roseofilum reptotaenium AO1-A]